MKKCLIPHENGNKRSLESTQTFSNCECEVYLVTARISKKTSISLWFLETIS